MSKHYVGETGTDITLNCGSDISLATVSNIKYTKPSGATGTWTGAVYNLNYVKYTTIVTSFDIAGVWKLQAYVESPTWTGYGEAVELVIYPVDEGIISGDLTSVLALKNYLGMPITNYDDDVLLQKLITRISDQIEGDCQRVFISSTYTEYYKGDDTTVLMTKQYPIISVTSIYDDIDRVWGATTQIPAASIIISDECEGMIILYDQLFSFSDDVENIKITYVAGYAIIPTDLEFACIKLCAADYVESKGLVAGFAEGERSPDKLRKSANNVIRGYRRIR
jgi:uncharacterized phiE125 gp8 family phage protein